MKQNPNAQAERNASPSEPHAVAGAYAHELPEINAVARRAYAGEPSGCVPFGCLVAGQQPTECEEADASSQGHRGRGDPVGKPYNRDQTERYPVSSDQWPNGISLYLDRDRPQVPDMAVVIREAARNHLIREKEEVPDVGGQVAPLRDADRGIQCQVGEQRRNETARSPSPEYRDRQACVELSSNQVSGQSEEHRHAEPANRQRSDVEQENGENRNSANSVQRTNSTAHVQHNESSGHFCLELVPNRPFWPVL